MSTPEDARARLRAWVTPDGAGYYYPEGGELDADLLAILDDHERLTAPPTCDEREALRAALFAWWDSLSEDSEVVADPLLDVILATLAGFRRQGPITDVAVRAALAAFVPLFPLVDNDWTPDEYADMRAALEAAREADR